MRISSTMSTADAGEQMLVNVILPFSYPFHSLCLLSAFRPTALRVLAGGPSAAFRKCNVEVYNSCGWF